MAVNILLVEDNPADARMAQEIIQETGHDVSLAIAEDGHQALSAVKNICSGKCPTILLLDLRFPKGDGFQILEFIKHSSCSSIIKKIVLTGSQCPEDKVKAEELGADAYLFKPMSPKDFNSLVEMLGSIIGTFAK